MSFVYRHWKTREPVTEEFARENGLAPPAGERWHATRETPYRLPNRKRMNARDAVRLGWLPREDVEDPLNDRPHTGNPESVNKAATKREQLQASAEESERQALAARARLKKQP